MDLQYSEVQYPAAVYNSESTAMLSSSDKQEIKLLKIAQSEHDSDQNVQEEQTDKALRQKAVEQFKLENPQAFLGEGPQTSIKLIQMYKRIKYFTSSYRLIKKYARKIHHQKVQFIKHQTCIKRKERHFYVPKFVIKFSKLNNLNKVNQLSIQASLHYLQYFKGIKQRFCAKNAVQNAEHNIQNDQTNQSMNVEINSQFYEEAYINMTLNDNFQTNIDNSQTQPNFTTLLETKSLVNQSLRDSIQYPESVISTHDKVNLQQKSSQCDSTKIEQTFLMAINCYFQKNFHLLKDAIVHYNQYIGSTNNKKAKLKFKNIGDELNLSEQACYQKFQALIAKNSEEWPVDTLQAVDNSIKKLWEQNQEIDIKAKKSQIRICIESQFNFKTLKVKQNYNYKAMTNHINYILSTCEK
ncbi:Hypothetical_protein [Hexamita inflata]|uniref:Hypothetical_protein n=1 Tax=Hexamita inflata TaxID=28002 RepID=A0AA86QTA7_9EUKA|nr:Hypothetical protein HINF_LOCUS50337 [Hexamita inflata]